jgi:hypothetical protein
MVSKPSVKKRRGNKGWFKKGFDPRRTYEFTRQDRRKGFRVTLCRYPHLLDWLMGKFLIDRDRRRREREKEPW